jgi:hypothetical protein
VPRPTFFRVRDECLEADEELTFGGLNEVNRTIFEAAVDHTGADSAKRRGFIRCDHAAALCASGAAPLLRYAGSVDDEDLRSFDIAFHFPLFLASRFRHHFLLLDLAFQP